MNHRKRFVSPRVVQEVQVLLEKDLLQGRSSQENMRAIIMGQEVEEHDLSSFTESYWE